MRPEDLVRLRHMFDATQSISRFVSGRAREDLESDEMLLFAVVHALQIIGEAASKVSPEGRAQARDVPWQEAIGIRHRLVHAYYDVDKTIIWKTATEAVPHLMAALGAVISVPD